MSTTLAILILVISFVGLIVLRFPIAITLAGSTLITLMYLNVPWIVVGQTMVQGINSFPLLAIPFFILAGQIMSVGGMALRIVNLAQIFVGAVRGGLALVSCVACMFFGNISGSAAADVSSVGSVLIPAMKKKGYDADFAVAVTTSASIQGVIVPPSHNLVMYSLAAGGISVSALFLGGIVPGLILLFTLMVVSYVIARKRQYVKGEPVKLKDVPKILRDGFLSLLTGVIILGGILSGWFTATEAGAIACAYAFILTFFVYRDVPLSQFWVVMKRTLRTVSMVLFLIAASASFGYVLAFLKVPALVTDLFLSVSTNPIIILMMINVLLLLLGFPMDMAPMILIMTPILLPIVTSLGIDPVHFGLILILNCGIGLITPPVGTVLFIGCAIGKVSVDRATKASLPFFFAMIAVLLLITYVPQITLWLPNLVLK
ncbi:TRAP transporter large permease [Paenibacillus sp. CGMCC 1.16610]|uniref:TRAP transporter large permease subunit n=1 Tax=Paenibacillus anseongense TaxID=2682845 RepID=A0ABW9U4D5_9BACL|nr:MULTISPECIES: TRAP transporter large permease [Paenibacillus]MBA2938990.1 TRAP transporter large permease [Paenibacillus sp. CGMCC 1.16610]MVQ34952.1 TRAP transporter large permease subunit [Paenibacillus anseongense]